VDSNCGVNTGHMRKAAAGEVVPKVKGMAACSAIQGLWCMSF